MTYLYITIEIVAFMLSLIGLTLLIGTYMADVFTGKDTQLTKPLKGLETLSYQIAGVEMREMEASEYVKSLIYFNVIGFFALFLMILFQKFLPLNPENFPGTSVSLAFNIAASYVTNTNWQSYVPETTLSYFTQMAGLTVQNFLSASTGLAVLIALTRGITRREKRTIGNFYVDIVRSVVYIFLPLSIIFALILLTQGVIQTLLPYLKITTLEGREQILPFGAVASQIAIKQLGTNGGGFFNANGAHPFENPTPLSNFLETLCIFLIPSASIYCYGIMSGMKKHATVIFSVIFFLFMTGFVVSLFGEHFYGVNIGSSPILEGKETRFGLFNSIIWSTATTATSNGSINAQMSSLSPLAGGVALFNMMADELIFGGVGVGLCSLIMFILLTVFIAGLMVGRTPEYMGKKIEIAEMQWIIVAVLAPAALILIGAGISSLLDLAKTDLAAKGPHGLSTILYAFASAGGNNGSAFANLNSNTAYYNIFLGVIMLIARFSILIPSLMIAGLLVKKKASPPTIGTFSTNSAVFGILLFSVILLGGALTFLPALALGPIAEHLLMMENRFF